MVNTDRYSELQQRLADLVHESARGEPAEASRHRRFIATRLIMGVVALAVLPVWFAIRGTVPHPAEYVVFACLIAPLFAALALSRTGSLPLAHTISAIAFAGLIVAIAGTTGGLASAATIWLVTVPLEALLSGSRRSATATTLVAIVAVVLIALMDNGTGASGWLPQIAAPVFALVAIAHAGALVAAASRREADDRREIARREAQDRHLLQIIDDLVTWHDCNGHVTHASAGAMKLIGVPSGALEERGLLGRVHIQDRPAYLKALSDAATGREQVNARLRLHYGDAFAGENGRVIWVEMRAYRLPDGDTGPGPVIAVMRDVSHQKRHEDELEQARLRAENADALKGRFLATVSHELRTPLNAIIGFSEILASDSMSYLDAEQRRDYARIIGESGHHLLDVVNALLDISKIESGNFDFNPTRFDMAALARSSVELIRLKAESRNIALDLDIPQELPGITADQRACRQILLNLLSNAVKFTPDGGRVGLGLRADARRMRITISDTGIGVGAQDLAQLGNPFFQAGGGRGSGNYDRTHEGTGLGLSVVRGLVGLHDGSLSIESGEDAGTLVSVEIPLDCGEEAREEARAPIPIHTAARQRAQRDPARDESVEETGRAPDQTGGRDRDTEYKRSA
jgi:cell cycle sensor histidine kinase DivJ